jgi:hypothetical protein
MNLSISLITPLLIFITPTLLTYTILLFTLSIKMAGLDRAQGTRLEYWSNGRLEGWRIGVAE